MANISFYGSHNSALVVENDGEILCVIEVERFSNYKNGGLAQYKTVKDPNVTLEQILHWINKTYNIKEFDNCIVNTVTLNVHNTICNLHKLIPHKNTVLISHHKAHASNAFYQSPFSESLIFSFDGGGDDGKFNIYKATRETGPQLLESIINPRLNNVHLGYDLGFPYATFGSFLGDIRLEPIVDGNLVYPGKIMGLCSYGTVHEDWIPYFIEYYKEDSKSGEYEADIQRIIGDRIGVKFDINNRLLGQIAYDVAATSQRAFEECFLEFARPYIEKFPDLPICITGGCGLNIILNTRIKNEFNRDVFVGPSPNDCGLATGLMLDFIRPKNQVDLTYKGIPLLDYDCMSEYIVDRCSKPIKKIVYTYDKLDNYDPTIFVNIDEVVDDLIKGLIIGVVRGNSEHGPRALGNRSIICNPSIKDMKDILNKKVKNREWYRPFAPVVRLEDVNKYFYWNSESRWMSFCPTVREEWREKLSAVTHVDNTARVQTVTKEQNPYLYDLITRVENKTGVGVILNTSFNVNGKPILSTLKDALEIFNKTQLDRLIVEDYYFTK